MSLDPLVLMAEIDRATTRLLQTASALDGIGAASLLPGWTRGHVLTHIARNADGLTNLLNWARTGVVTPQYASWEQRERDIAAGAPRDLPEQLADIRDSAARFAAAAAEVPAGAWAVVLDTAPQKPAAYVVWRRLREVEVHHVDLAAGYAYTDWPAAFGHRLLHEVVTDLTGRDGVPAMLLRPTDSGHELVIGDGASGPAAPDPAAPVITGTAGALACWLAGRSPGSDLTVSPRGELPTPPPWM